MKHPAFKKLIIAGGAAFALLAVPLAASTVAGLDLGVISAAQAAEHSGGAGGAMKGGGGAKKGGAMKGGAGKGGAASKKIFRVPVGGEDEDSDRPAWAGVKGGKAGGGGQPTGAGTKKGDLFGDMVILLRDDNGEPLLTADGLVKVAAFVYEGTTLVPLLDADGKQVFIPYNEEGDLVTEIDGVAVYAVEVDLGRLSVGRSPTKVLNHALDEALKKLTAPDAVITVDATGRLVVDGVAIDSPLENLALYDVYMTTGTIPGVTLPADFNVAALLAAASDKTGTITVDTVVYMNSILGINPLKGDDPYYDFSTYNYDRAATWGDVTVTVLVLQEDGVTYKAEEVNVYDTLFDADADGDGDAWVDSTTGGADDFAQAADDYLQVLEFVHDNAVR